MLRPIAWLLFLLGVPGAASAQLLPGFKPSPYFQEQVRVVENEADEIRILLNAPLTGFGKHDRVLLVLYALPNGNTIEQTLGKKMSEGVDWRYNIQNIGAQTRFLRKMPGQPTLVVAYLEAGPKSWPAWKKRRAAPSETIRKTVEELEGVFAPWNPRLVLSGHSGGGSFIFGYLDGVKEIPGSVSRIAFLDANYGYDREKHREKSANWLQGGDDRALCVLAYNDGVALYEGKPFVSATGGTWYKSKRMLDDFSTTFRFQAVVADSMLYHKALDGRLQVILKTNPERKIFHTVQVERNGFIHSVVSGTSKESAGYGYFGERVYDAFVQPEEFTPIRSMNIPPRPAHAEPGSRFMKRISSLPLPKREQEIEKAVASGNIPDFLRSSVTVRGRFTDASGTLHRVEYEVMPDYLAVGSDSDFCRVPMAPHTAQKIASRFGAVLPTPKLCDDVYAHAEIKLPPVTYAPVGNANENPSKFVEHNDAIEKQIEQAKGTPGRLVAGIKKDVVLSARIEKLPNKVVLYGWHQLDGKPIQPVYAGHADWYVDYSHGIRLINNSVWIDGRKRLLSEVLQDPVLYKMFSHEDGPLRRTGYRIEK